MATAQACKTFFITGAARGIGRGLSRLLLQQGHRVFLVDSDATELAHTATLLSRTHARGTAFDTAPCDVRDPSAVRAVASQAQLVLGAKLDCLVNNAAYTGGVGGTPLATLPLEEWERSVATNLTGPMLVTQACLPMLRAARGCVVHVSSTRAFMSEPDNEGYAASKAGLVGLAQSMAVSLARDGVRVSAVLPGWIHVLDECREADEAGRRWEDGLGEEDMRWQLTGRVGRVEDVMRAVMYLVENDGVTGVEMVVDGGVTRKMVYPE
ncbi:putative oxidoreductase [Escovopsis weberi]|uniref:Putative oxidoreductase n=1 Tax=Escovopsis weberi TaxID=150374 RepID=A0A0M8N9X3_ESCWE|nr:putative oxidoreductase [Escovopsis weberi]